MIGGREIQVKNGEIYSEGVNVGKKFRFYSSDGYAEKAYYIGYTYSEPPYWQLVLHQTLGSNESEEILKYPVPPNN